MGAFLPAVVGRCWSKHDSQSLGGTLANSTPLPLIRDHHRVTALGLGAFQQDTTLLDCTHFLSLARLEHCFSRILRAVSPSPSYVLFPWNGEAQAVHTSNHDGYQ